MPRRWRCGSRSSCSRRCRSTIPRGTTREKLYHGFILGLLVQLEGRYEVRSNRESGLGRADVLVRPKQPGRPGVVLELKVDEVLSGSSTG